MTTQPTQPSSPRPSSPRPSSPSPSSASSVYERSEDAVIAALNREQLLLHAASLHQHLHGKVSTPTIGEPMTGSFNICYSLTFDGGLRWLIKIPMVGTDDRWNEMSASALTSEVNTMRLLKRQTTIPLPEVLDFSSTLSNPIRCPFILMSYIPGMSLWEFWYKRQRGLDMKTVRIRRTRALRGVVRAMLQLSKFTFATGGSLVFNKDGTLDPSRTGPLRMWDYQDGLNTSGPYAKYKEIPVSSDTKDYYTFMIDAHPSDHWCTTQTYALLRQFIEWIPEPTAGGKPFVLAHPDFNLQNFIVNSDGELKGVIDWDGVGALPRTIGNEKLPGWLTEDWNYDSQNDPVKTLEELADEQEKPDDREDLPYNRAVYIRLLEEEKRRMSRNKSHYQRFWNFLKERTPDGKLQQNICRMSLINDNLAAAVWDPVYRGEILSKLVRECWLIQGCEEDYRFEGEMGAFLVGDEVDEDDPLSIEHLKQGFLMLLAEEGL
ncbi:kinase-like domain-containing protein [Aspergillus multicolor]|uniref:phosphotransferase family protein n=1 Tax=Aspergillus multicolor TaxID=41759 RepID=UPI003CCC9E4C